MFTFLAAETKPEHKLVVIGSDDAFILGVLSSRLHVTYALATGGWLGVGNDPVYSKLRCFDPFPFPLCGEAERERIRKLAEELDARRKRVQAQHPGLTLTDLYNVLEKLRANQPLNTKEQEIHEAGLVSVLKQLHDDLDAAVFAAYGWPATLTDAEILERVVALNTERAREESQGIIRWLRPEYQQRGQKKLTLPDAEDDSTPAKRKPEKRTSKAKQPWPSPLAERVKAVESALHAAGGAVTPEKLTQQFARAKPANVKEILETLVTLGRARRAKDGEGYQA